MVLTAIAASGQHLSNPPVLSKQDNTALTVGTHFRTNTKSVIVGIRYWRDANFTGATVGHVWENGRMIESGTFPAGTGWIYLPLKSPIVADSGKTFTVSYCNDGGYYTWQEFYWQNPRRFPLWTGTGGGYVYTRNAYPALSWNAACYFVEPILQAYVEPSQKVDTVLRIVRDSIWVSRDTCGGGLKEFVESGGSMALMLPEEGGSFMLPDSTTLLMALQGAAPPHKRLANDTSLIHERFFRGTGDARRRITLYRTGAYVIEKYNAVTRLYEAVLPKPIYPPDYAR